MGSTESSEGRRVSFGMDEEERVRVLQGIRLSENVVNRMKGSSQPSKAGQPTPPSPSGTSEGPEKDAKPPRSEHSGSRPAGVDEDVLKRYKQEQAMVQDELLQVATREREAATQQQRVSLQRGEGSVDQDKWRSDQLNAEIYKLSSQQFHEAASKMEGMIRPRRLEPACSGLQAQILRCYRDHLQEVLLCSDLVKAYQRCVSAARKG
ncbi:MICOS complex subunit MIC25 isoform X2 [Equus quagga]|uniref:MICOS complex subunit MIC25 isoform X2 n=1 Tax=Equus quagga TaxID=89248 RepID=UPI001EE2B021|nr:MICOS complex subunit MIC25 isoform X2 [Equus quagga]